MQLFDRSIEIITEVSGVCREDATAALLKAIHRGGEIDKVRILANSIIVQYAPCQMHVTNSYGKHYYGYVWWHH